MMFSLAVSLLIVVSLLKLPAVSDQSRVGWGDEDVPRLRQVSESRSSVATRIGGKIESFGVPEGAPPVPVEQDPGDGLEPDEADHSTRAMAVRQTVYEHVESPPAIRGGLGAYYINIEYPAEAVRQGIEGRLMLKFVVDTEGRPTNISVLTSLHPLCDSAAVRALRETTFVPGRQNGMKVPVRMHLPVRFRLVTSLTNRIAESDST